MSAVRAGRAPGEPVLQLHAELFLDELLCCHSQQISKAAVVFDAMAIRKQIISLRQRLCVNVAAQAAPAGGARA